MIKLLGKILGVLALCWGGSTSAALMPPVSVNGQQWLQPLDFINYSWNEVASVCDDITGVCNGPLGGNDLTGWIWAGSLDLQAVFTAMGIPNFSGGNPQQFHFDATANSTWAPDFLATFLPTVTVGARSEVYGLIRNPYGANQTAIGTVGDNLTSAIVPITVDAAGVYVASTGVDDTSPDVGGWFYRTDVSSPATLTLLSLGLAGLGLSRRKHLQPSAAALQ